MLKQLNLIILFAIVLQSHAQISIVDAESKLPVSYASISFGNGNGIVADDEGIFVFTKKLYPDIDSLYISALGYKELAITVEELEPQLFLHPQADELDEVVIGVKIDRTKDKKYKTESLKPYLDDDYYKCWLPTIESEIAVYFPNEDDRLKRIAKVKFPIALESKDWKNRKKANKEKKKFSTLFKVNLYENLNGKPGRNLNTETIVFRATEQDGDYHELDIEEQNILIPEEGVFISLQVLGYTNKNGKLLPNKKYKEIKGPQGIIKIPTNFRPLLPFTDEIDENRTYVKRVFINGNDWQAFKKGNGFQSSLLKSGLNNYGIGIDLHVFKD
ncbi:peptidase associated/transthyretin-like domain-containing protein [Winogradskyella jejuensis]|uniref:CarboxypepD_reg-like domain-containing protein n=1 Tax=Winogradskyella jejuensis TaxID=1089305 RepID=A0A1M5K0W3_9FLAO|nr:hypothetical protein [Winogradskyella jejuensis]SHG46502.1 hypothetical protein SAMN05444148_0200 [Winogradskyella jejuensis]